MRTRKRASVTADMLVDVKGKPLPLTEQEPPEVMADPTLPDLRADKATTIHMKRITWLELRRIAAEHDTTMHALCIEGLKMVFAKYGADPGHVLAGARPPVKPKAR